jgi:hypothetical protein
MITTYDAITGITTQEPVSKELAAERAAELKALQDSLIVKKTARDEILAKLGLTADEAAILLG